MKPEVHLEDILYRENEPSVLICSTDFVFQKWNEKRFIVLEVGAGCGVLGMGLAQQAGTGESKLTDTEGEGMGGNTSAPNTHIPLSHLWQSQMRRLFTVWVAPKTRTSWPRA